VLEGLAPSVPSTQRLRRRESTLSVDYVKIQCMTVSDIDTPATINIMQYASRRSLSRLSSPQQNYTYVDRLVHDMIQNSTQLHDLAHATMWLLFCSAIASSVSTASPSNTYSSY
jgi:hypothetical protein